MPTGACRDLPEDQKRMFYGKQGYADAKRICNTVCQMRDECLADARAWEETQPYRFGIWGGKSANERDQMFGRRSLKSDEVAA